MYWFRLSRPGSMYMLSSELMGLGFRLQISDNSPASMAGIFRGGLLQVLLLKCQRFAVSVLIASVTSLLRCRPDISLAVLLPGFWLVVVLQNNSDVTDTTSTETTANLRHFRSNSWSSHLWRCLPQMQTKFQEFVTWDHDPPARKTPYTELLYFLSLKHFIYLNGNITQVVIFSCLTCINNLKVQNFNATYNNYSRRSTGLICFKTDNSWTISDTSRFHIHMWDMGSMNMWLC